MHVQALGNLRTGSRLVGAFLLVAALVVGVSAVGYASMSRLSGSLTSMYHQELLPVNDLVSIQVDLYTIRGDVYKFMLAPEDRAATRTAIAQDTSRVDERVESLRATDMDSEETALLDEFDTAWQDYCAEVQSALADVEAEGDEAIAAVLSTGSPVAVARGAVDKAINDLVAHTLDSAETADELGDSAFASASRVMLLVCGLRVLAAVGLGLTISRGITSPLATLVGMANSLAQGDLLRNQSEAAKAALQRRRN